jgi:phosphoribosyl 1,2-cyclic phosphodiesterase
MDAEKQFEIKFWGVRGSHPVAGEHVAQFGGNTPCVQIMAGAHNIILDAGTGIINLGRDWMRERQSPDQPLLAALFFSHLHLDHTQGLPFFAPLYDSSSRLDFFLPDLSSLAPEKILADVMREPAFPVPFQQTAAHKTLHKMDVGRVIVLGHEPGEVRFCSLEEARSLEDVVLVRAMHSYAHPQGVLIYRIEWAGRSVIYATDTEGYVNGDQRLVNFARGADILIHDAQYTEEHYLGRWSPAPVTQGYGHSTAAMACKVARDAEIGQLILFHHDPNYADSALEQIESLAQKIFINVRSAREGLMLSVPASQISQQRQRVLAV